MVWKLACGAAAMAAVVLASLWATGWIGSAPEGEQPAHTATPAPAVVGKAPTDRSLPATDTNPAANRELVGAGELAPLLLAISSEDGAPVVHAKVFVQCGGTVTEATTDVVGHVEFTPIDDAADILVLASGRAPMHRKLPSAHGKHPLVMPTGAQVTGRVQIHGGGDPSDIALAAWTQERAPAFAQDLPPALAQLLKENRSTDWMLRTRTDARGDFAFVGLPSDWAGSLRVFDRYWIRPKETSVESSNYTATIEQPTDGVLLSLVRVPGLSGRVVWTSGEPVKNPELIVSASFAKGIYSPSTSTVGEVDGRFDIALSPSRTTHGELWLAGGKLPAFVGMRYTVEHDEASASLTVVLPEDKVVADGNLGTIVLERAPIAHAIVVDAAGQPMAGAVIEAPNPSAPSNDQGQCKLHLADGNASVSLPQRKFRIGAPGATVEFYGAESGSGTPTDPLRFRMRKGNSLEVTVSLGDLPPKNVRLAVHSDEPLWTANDPSQWRPGKAHQAAGASRSTSASGSKTGPGYVELDLDAKGRAVLPSVKPGLAVSLRVLDGFGRAFVERELRTPESDKITRVELEVDPKTVAEFIGMVTLDGAAVHGANVELRGNRRGRGALTDDLGEFKFFAVATTDPLKLTIRSDTATRLQDTLILHPGQVRESFALQRGHSLEVRVIDPEGRPVDARVVASTGQQSTLGEGRVRLDQLPAGEMTVTARIAGREFTKRVDPETTKSVEILVPAVVKIRLQILESLPGPFIALQLVGDQDEELRQQVTMMRNNGVWTPPHLLVFPGTYSVSCTIDEATATERVWRAQWVVAPGTSETRTLLGPESTPSQGDRK